MKVSQAPWPFENMTRENPKHVSKWAESEGAELWRVFAPRVGKQQIFLTAWKRGFCACMQR